MGIIGFLGFIGLLDSNGLLERSSLKEKCGAKKVFLVKVFLFPGILRSGQDMAKNPFWGTRLRLPISVVWDLYKV